MVAVNLWKNDRSYPRSFMDSMFRDFDRLFENLPRTYLDERALESVPPCDVKENDDSFLITMDLPGIKKSDIDVDFSNGLMTISGKRESSHEEKNGNFLRMERSTGTFRRSFQVPQGINVEDIEASHADGVLYVTLPKAEASKGRKIEVNSGKLGFLKKLAGKSEKQKDAANS